MKVEASLNRERDRDDLAALWPLAGFSDASAAAAAHAAAYPDSPDDPYLVEWLEEVATEATGR